MRRAAIIAIILAGRALLSAPAGAQPASLDMTVDELVARALAENPELRAAQAEVDAAGGRLRQAGLRPNPMLDLGFQKALSPDNNFNVGLTVPLDLNGRKEGRVAVADRELAMKRAQLADRNRRLAADVRLKAGELLAARRNLAVTHDLLAVNRQALGLVQERVRQGAAPPLEENLLAVEVNRLDANRQLLASRLEVLALQVKALAGMEPDMPLAVRGELASPPTVPDRVTAVAEALARRADIAAARAESATARARIGKEEAEGRWDASVNVGYMRQDVGFAGLNGLTDSGATRPIQDVFHYFGAGLTITLPVRNRNQGNVAAARAETRAAERRQQFAELTARQEVEATYTQHEAAGRALELYERGVRDAARRNLEVVRQTYELGRTTILDVIAEQRRYIDIETGYTDALKQVYDAAVEIRRAVGTSDR